MEVDARRGRLRGRGGRRRLGPRRDLGRGAARFDTAPNNENHIWTARFDANGGVLDEHLESTAMEPDRAMAGTIGADGLLYRTGIRGPNLNSGGTLVLDRVDGDAVVSLAVVESELGRAGGFHRQQGALDFAALGHELALGLRLDVDVSARADSRVGHRGRSKQKRQG